MKLDKYIYKIRPLRAEMLAEGPTDRESSILQDHVAYLQRLAAESVVLLAGRTQTTDDSSFGIVILQAASQPEAYDIMMSDPAIKHGVMDTELFPYKIAVLSRAIEAELQ